MNVLSVCKVSPIHREGATADVLANWGIKHRCSRKFYYVHQLQAIAREALKMDKLGLTLIMEK